MPNDTGIKEITILLNAAAAGEEFDQDQLYAMIYEDLRKIARKYLRSERANITLQATALVHEAYPQLLKDANWETRSHFFAYAARVMRNLLIDHAKKKMALKQGGDLLKVSLEGVAVPVQTEQDLLDLDRELTRLAEISPRQARIMEYHYFGGLGLVFCRIELGLAKCLSIQETR